MLELRNIIKSYPRSKGLFGRERLSVLKGVSLQVHEGECLGLIGESGSGKSTLGKLVLGLEKPDSGEILFNGEPNRQKFQTDMSVVFQDYSTSVNPRFKVQTIIAEPLRRENLSPKVLKERIAQLLTQVGLNETFIDRLPHELSGGQLQRVCIARAISTNPRFLVLDEAVSSLDASVQMQILELLKELKEQRNLSYLFITHDLLTITYICDRILFFKEGCILEEVKDMMGLRQVKDPYSRKLLLHA